MKIATLFAENDQVIQLHKQNKELEICVISEIPTDWIKKSKLYPCLSLHKAIHMYHEGKIDRFLVFPILKKNLSFFYEDVLKQDINEEDILYVSLSQMVNNDFHLESFVTFRDRADLDYVSIHVMDCCNLKCAHCSSMSGLVKQEMNISFSKTSYSIYQLSHVYESVNYIQIIGGEPLLNDRIQEYCLLLRECFPYAFIEIVTNGTLLLSQHQNFFDMLNAIDVALLVSYYPINASYIDRINAMLRNNDITYTISDKIICFEKYYDFSGTSDINQTFWNCQSAQYCKNGLTLYEDYIYPCVAPISLFRADVITDSTLYGIRISEHTSRQDVNSLVKPLEICKYCHMDQFQKWHQLENNELNCWESWSI